MTPRCSTSVAKNRTKLPADALKLMQESLREAYPDFLGQLETFCEGYIYLEEIILRFGFREKGSLRQMNFEASMDYNKDKQNPMDVLYAAFDAVGSMLGQFVEAEGDIEFPGKWTEYEFDKQKVWLQTSTENSELEAAADALLGEDFLNEQTEIDEAFVDELFDKIRRGELKH